MGSPKSADECCFDVYLIRVHVNIVRRLHDFLIHRVKLGISCSIQRSFVSLFASYPMIELDLKSFFSNPSSDM